MGREYGYDGRNRSLLRERLIYHHEITRNNYSIFLVHPAQIKLSFTQRRYFPSYESQPL